MTHFYTIKAETWNEVKTICTTTRKREIESMFNKLMRNFSKAPNYTVENIRMGYSKVTWYGTYGSIETEYWIARS